MRVKFKRCQHQYLHLTGKCTQCGAQINSLNLYMQVNGLYKSKIVQIQKQMQINLELQANKTNYIICINIDAFFTENSQISEAETNFCIAKVNNIRDFIELLFNLEEENIFLYQGAYIRVKHVQYFRELLYEPKIIISKDKTLQIVQLLQEMKETIQYIQYKQNDIFDITQFLKLKVPEIVYIDLEQMRGRYKLQNENELYEQVEIDINIKEKQLLEKEQLKKQIIRFVAVNQMNT